MVTTLLYFSPVLFFYKDHMHVYMCVCVLIVITLYSWLFLPHITLYCEHFLTT